jgi:hypothetical protein
MRPPHHSAAVPVQQQLAKPVCRPIADRKSMDSTSAATAFNETYSPFPEPNLE